MSDHSLPPSDKSVRQKTRQKYAEFLEEQTKRNERNKKLVAMLERIDEQTAAMSQRSERLKMMKVSRVNKATSFNLNQCFFSQSRSPLPAAIPNVLCEIGAEPNAAEHSTDNDNNIIPGNGNSCVAAATSDGNWKRCYWSYCYSSDESRPSRPAYDGATAMGLCHGHAHACTSSWHVISTTVCTSARLCATAAGTICWCRAGRGRYRRGTATTWHLKPVRSARHIARPGQ